MLKFMVFNHYRASDTLNVIPCFLDDDEFSRQ